MSLHTDLRWPGFAERYASDVQGFAREVCGIDVGEPLTPPVERLMVRHAGQRNAGAHARQVLVLAVMALWHLTTRPQSTTLVASAEGVACQTNRAIGQLLAHMRTGAYYWVARGIKHRPSGWVITGRTESTIDLRKVSAKRPAQMLGGNSSDLLWLIEAGDDMPPSCYSAVADNLASRSTAQTLTN